MSNEKNLHFETLQLHVGQEQADPATDARAVPIYQTTSYVFHNAQHASDRFHLKDAGNIYGRLTNTTQGVFEDRVAALEGGVGGLAVASGAATIYGGTYNLLKHTLSKYGIDTTFVNPDDYDALEAAIKPNTKLVYIETLGNPNSNISDIERSAEIAHKHGIPLVIDNTFGTPYLINPIKHGADIVVHSATKFIGGHGSSLGGVIVDGGKFDYFQNDKFPGFTKPDASYHGLVFGKLPAPFVTRVRALLLRDEGACISPFNAWILLQGLETLSLRVERHVFNTLKVIDYLKTQPLVKKINHPSLPDHPNHDLYERYFPNGAGSIFTFEIEGGQKAAWNFIDHLKIFSDLANVADVKSLVVHPKSTTHSELSDEEASEQGIFDGTIRLSIGTEHYQDLIDDLDQAFKAVKN